MNKFSLKIEKKKEKARTQRMTSFDCSIQAFDFPQFSFSHKTKKASRKNKVTPSAKNSIKSQGHFNNKNSFAFKETVSYSGHYAYQGQARYPYSNAPNFAKFGKGQYQNNFSDQFSKSNYASTADSDNNNNDVFSELSGFKVVQNGRVLHNEAGEDFDSSDNETNWLGEIHGAKFAASTLTVGPNAKDISLPSFA